MKLNNETKDIIGGVIVCFIIAGFIFWAGHAVGSLHGMEEQRESRKRAECEVGYSHVPQKDIPGKCLKYFIKK